jgi:hypothetical protein
MHDSNKTIMDAAPSVGSRWRRRAWFPRPTLVTDLRKTKCRQPVPLALFSVPPFYDIYLKSNRIIYSDYVTISRVLNSNMLIFLHPFQVLV